MGAWEGPPAPYRIETERLVIRCYDPRDAAKVKDAIDSSLDHLRPWMPWVEAEPQTLEEKTDLLKSFRAQFDAGDNFVVGVFSADESEVLGGSGLHPRVGPGGLEIGYFVRSSAKRQGYITESTAALTRVGFEICGADRIEIRIDPENEVSKGVPRKLGYVEEATLRRRLPARAGGSLRDVTIYTLFREDYDPSIAPGIRAFDARGEQVL
ncbi:MAG TPA: GNAT family protein [Gaiellaceae bacterium]|nr:GNAT family protein [Gaiellaceae bacterium]